MEIIFNLFNFKQKIDYKTEVLSGLTVAMALIPEAVAFAMIAGLSPLTGLYAAFVMGLVTSILGGRPGMILISACQCFSNLNRHCFTLKLFFGFIFSVF
jgi:SulP family sulfate permease